MAFWKKSDDPWNRKPTPTTYTSFEEPREEAKGFFEELRDDIQDWRDKRKAAAEEEEANLPPEKCPWCGKEMERGYLDAVKGGEIWWVTEKPGFKNDLLGPDPKTSLLLTNEGAFYTYKTAWYCPGCEKMTADCADMRRPYEPVTSFDETKESEV